jgi:hypothetical protein
VIQKTLTLKKNKIYSFPKIRFDNFFSVYELENKVNCNVKRKSYISDSHINKCRFCGREEPKIKITNKAYVIPKYLGNKYVVTKNECTSCNTFFAKYNQALDFYTKDYLRLAGLSYYTDKDNKKFKMFIESFERSINWRKIIYHTENRTDFSFLIEKSVYRPLFVYKALLKIGLYLIPDKFIDYHKSTINFLYSEGVDNYVIGNPFLRMFSYFVPGAGNKIPSALLYKKKANCNDKIPERTLLLFFLDHIYQIFFPFYFSDENLLNIKKDWDISFPIAPLLLPVRLFNKNHVYSFNNIDMSSNRRVRDDSFYLNVKLVKENKIN